MKATVDLKYEDVKCKLKAIFGDMSSSSKSDPFSLKTEVKAEDVFEAESVAYVRTAPRGRKKVRGVVLFLQRGMLM